MEPNVTFQRKVSLRFGDGGRGRVTETLGVGVVNAGERFEKNMGKGEVKKPLRMREEGERLL